MFPGLTTRSVLSAGLFSAYAEVFPATRSHRISWNPFLCLRRGVSVFMPGDVGDDGFSLPTQRCFHYLLFRGEPNLTFLCLRRGVSECERQKFRLILFSLPTQRCFRKCFHVLNPPGLFSAYAEVFPDPASGGSPEDAFLCLRRGVSHWSTLRSGEENFSLPTQRCFPMTHCVELSAKLFSAYAEVFPAG